MTSPGFKKLVLAACLFCSPALCMDKARLEERVDEAIRKFGVAGRGVATNTRFSIQVTRNGVRSNAFVANTLPRNPEFFLFDGRYIAAVHLNGDLVAKVDLFPGLWTRPPKPGDIIQMYGTGCGATNPAIPADRIVTAAAPVTGTVKLTIGGKDANPSFVGVTGSGLCQINGQIPDLPPGHAEVVLQIDSFVSADGTFITVQ